MSFTFSNICDIKLIIDAAEQRVIVFFYIVQGRSKIGPSIGVPDRGARGAVAPLGFGKLVKFGQMGWEIRAFRGLNFSR